MDDKNPTCYTLLVKAMNDEYFSATGSRRKYFCDTYGCQQNESDSELLRGSAESMGYLSTENESDADLIIVNTCAVREHAEMRILGNVGAMSHIKRRNPDLIIILTGCMMSEPAMREKIKKSFPYVSGTLDTNSHDLLPEMVYSFIRDRKRQYYYDENRDILNNSESMTRVRTSGIKAWLPIMKGCDNFCSYCIVPYVRGREQSRDAEAVIAEAADVVSSGYKEITLLGQNVNSYKGIEGGFPELLRRINDIEGNFRIRFMTSHPKDATPELFYAMRDCEKVCLHLHLPFQSGSNRILREMNRGYTSEIYSDKIALARSLMPSVAVTSDVIVGFPGETEEDYLLTEKLVKEIGFVSLFTFIYSRRSGTKAASIPDSTPSSVIKERFMRLVALQDGISSSAHAALVGQEAEVLIDGRAKDRMLLTSRTDNGRLVLFEGSDSLIGSFKKVRITDSNTWSLIGTLTD